MKCFSMLLKIAIKENIAPCFLDFIGIMEDMHGIKLYLFNVEDSTHNKYKSTLGIKEK